MRCIETENESERLEFGLHVASVHRGYAGGDVTLVVNLFLRRALRRIEEHLMQPAQHREDKTQRILGHVRRHEAAEFVDVLFPDVMQLFHVRYDVFHRDAVLLPQQLMDAAEMDHALQVNVLDRIGVGRGFGQFRRR
jgi:hypothetical protein